MLNYQRVSFDDRRVWYVCWLYIPMEEFGIAIYCPRIISYILHLVI